MRVGSRWIDFERLFQGWSLMALNTSLMGSFNGVKCCSVWKARGKLGEGPEALVS